MICSNSTDIKEIIYAKKILIDSNVIIYLTDKVTPYFELSQVIFTCIEKGEAFGVLSVLSIAEVIQGPIKKGLLGNALQLRDYLFNFPNIFCQNIDKEVIEYIGKDNRVNWSGLRSADSLIIASGLKAEVNFILSNDTRFKKAISPEFLISF